VTWDQFTAVLLGLAATALVRLLDRWLPTEGTAAVAGETTAAPPTLGDLHVIDDQDPPLG
jgi:hypothetical protein